MTKHEVKMGGNIFSRRRFLATAAAFGAGLLTGQNVLAQSGTYRRIYCPILMYHYISYPPPDADSVLLDLTVTPELFSEHLTQLQSMGFTTVSMMQLWQALTEGFSLPEKPVVITFDDGYDNAYGEAAPRLLEKGMRGTFFIVSGFMDQPGYLTWGQALEMRNAGMEIGNHSATHPNLTSLDETGQRAEIDGAAARIGEVMGARPQFFCYPLGRYNNMSIRILKETGHLAAVTTSDGTLKYTANPFRMSRVRIRHTTTIASLQWLVNRRV